MGEFLDSVPFSGIIRIRDMMYGVKDPFRLDQGDVSFDAPETVKAAMRRAVDENRSHYLQTTGLPRLVELLAEKLKTQNGIPIGAPDEVMGEPPGSPRPPPHSCLRVDSTHAEEIADDLRLAQVTQDPCPRRRISFHKRRGECHAILVGGQGVAHQIADGVLDLGDVELLEEPLEIATGLDGRR